MSAKKHQKPEKLEEVEAKPENQPAENPPQICPELQKEIKKVNRTYGIPKLYDTRSLKNHSKENTLPSLKNADPSLDRYLEAEN